MTSNFDFLKNKEQKLFGIINDAEKLYRDGYFEQTIVQTRKFAEIITKTVLGVRRTTEETFDEMLGTLKDILGENPSDKEFIDDLYFIKNKGNLAAHEAAVPLSGNEALECLQRAFELSVNYAIKKGFANKKILNSHYSIDLLMTGKNYKFSEKYQEVKEQETEGIEEIVERAQTPEEKIVKADFKKKKVIKDKKETKEKKKETKEKRSKKEKKEKEIKEKPQNKDALFYVLVFGVLIVLLICIMLFILPL